MYSTKYSVSIHILSLIALKDEQAMTSDRIAGSVNTNPALVRRLMSSLKKANLIKAQTKLGILGLTKPPEEISLLQVFKAVEKEQNLFAMHGDPNPNCPVGARIGSALEYVNQQVQTEFEKDLDSVFLSDILKGMDMDKDKKD